MAHAALRIDHEPARLQRFLSALARSGFRGEIADDIGTRTVHATDNSIYQVVPSAVLFPREGDDLNRIVRLAASSEYGPIALAPRGGGTGTNGQSLTSGVIVDTSRHMNRIEHLDVEAGLVTVQPGVVLNQLNDFLKAHDLFFPPTVSTASRATLGGMVATDASGKGSRLYGKTSDYIDAMDVVLADGSDWRAEALTDAARAQLTEQDSFIGRIHREVNRVVTGRRDLIAEIFPVMNRGLTGYNLQGVVGKEGLFRLSYLLAGSEGTLALTKQLTLRVRRRPSHRALVAIRYASFTTALVDVQRLLAAEPAAIEILDDKVLHLAQQDAVWADIEGVLGGATTVPVGGLNVVEFVGDALCDVETAVARLIAILSADPAILLDWTIVTDPQTIAQLWSLREKSVGLLGRLGGERQGTAFVEDTAVPPERLADYVRDFREILDRYKLNYGMFGHADVGCLHVRPALNMREPADAALIRPISDEVAALTREYGGLLWGEHGRGFRGEYSPFFFGPELYKELCRIKAVFDPQNIFNPGKLASPDGTGHIDRIDRVPFRGTFDRAIAREHTEDYGKAIACNGNGACFNWDVADPMCPSFKATGDRSQSPKGRAALLREWARLDSEAQSGALPAELPAIEAAVKASLSTCLSCKACSSQCPVKVDIPDMKAQFLDRYHRRVRRPIRDYVIAGMEAAVSLMGRFPWLANVIMKSALAKALAKRLFGLVDLPRLSPAKRSRALKTAELSVLSPADKQRSIILAEDTFTSSFDGSVVEAVVDLFRILGYTVYRAPPRANGKSLHVLGMLRRFSKVADAALSYHAALLETGVAVVGIEPVIVLMHDHEYRAAADTEPQACEGRVQSIEEFLAAEIEAGRILPMKNGASPRIYSLFLHCTEKTAKPRNAALWTHIFDVLGLKIEHQSTGCCGMAGVFGHEVEHAEMSRKLFDMSWKPRLIEVDPSAVLATGFSCRCQIERAAGFRPRHPAEALAVHLTA